MGELGLLEHNHWILPHCRACRHDAAQAVDRSRLCCSFRFLAISISRLWERHKARTVLLHDGDWTVRGLCGQNVSRRESIDEALKIAMHRRGEGTDAGRWSLANLCLSGGKSIEQTVLPMEGVSGILLAMKTPESGSHSQPLTAESDPG